MATNALEVVSLATIRSELRIPDNSHDALLLGQINSAVSFVSEPLRAPLLDRAEGFRCSRPADSYPIVIPSANVRSISSIKYWTATGNLRLEPDGSIDVSTLGRLQESDGGFVIYPPAAGWPEVLADSLIEITVIRGMNTPAALQAAVVLCVRQLYNGYRDIRPTEAFWALIDPFRSYAFQTDGFTPRTVAPVVGDHTRYFGWSDDRVIATADFGAAGMSSSNVGTLPQRATNGYIWFAVPETAGYPSSLHIDNGPIDQIAVYVQQAGTVDDLNGQPHLVGVSFDIQGSVLSGQEIELGY